MDDDQKKPEENQNQTQTPPSGENEKPPVEGVEEEVVVSIGDEEVTPGGEEKKTPQWVKDVRQVNREKEAENRELRRKLERYESQKEETLGDKPTLSDCKFDNDVYERELDSWYDKKNRIERKRAEAERVKKEQEQNWNSQLANHHKKAGDLGLPDFEDAQNNVQASLTQTQMGIIVHAAENSALLVYALDKDPQALTRIAAIKDDPIRFTSAIAKLESKIKMTKRPRETAPPPEGRVEGSGGPPAMDGNTDATLEKLREKAAKTGDLSEVVAYKAKLRAQK